MNSRVIFAVAALLSVVGSASAAKVEFKNKGDPVPQSVQVAVRAIVDDAKIAETVVVTSYRRSAESQATEMIDNFDRAAPAAREKLIADYANQVEADYRAAATDSSASKEQRIANLAARLTALVQSAGPSRTYLQHVVIAGIEPQNDAVDIGYSSVPEASRQTLIEAVKRSPLVDQSRFFYYPDKPWEKAYHIEFTRN